MRAEARGPDFYTALAAALAKLKTQLRRSHDRHQMHHGHRTPTSIAETTRTLGLRTTPMAPGTANDDEPGRQRESCEVEGPGHIEQRLDTQRADPTGRQALTASQRWEQAGRPECGQRAR